MGSTMESRVRRRERRLPKGAIVVLVAATLVILFAAAAFSVDVAYMFLAGEQMHVATDAAAKAAVTTLSQGGTSQTAITAAINCAAANMVCGNPLTITSSNVTLGKVAYSQSGTWTFTAGGTPTTAAKVTGTSTVPLFFAPLFGNSTYSPSQSSTAAFVRNKWCFVIDRSASMAFDMSGTDWKYPDGQQCNSNSISCWSCDEYCSAPHATKSRWANLRVAVSTFLSCISSSPVENQVGMTTFADSSKSDCSFSTTYTPITTALSTYGNNPIYGGTNMYSGLQAAITLFSNSNDTTPWNKMIIVFSDGQWNQGSDPLNLVSQATNAGITIYTVGLLPASNNPTMQSLASQTGGKFYYAATGTDLTNAFKAIANTIPVILTQ
jgi:Ca-activated chloride channel homolog